jgi:hypothetical protein
VSSRGKEILVGRYDDEERAAVERDKVALRVIGRLARLNFDPSNGEPIYGARLRDLQSGDAARRKGG